MKQTKCVPINMPIASACDHWLEYRREVECPNFSLQNVNSLVRLEILVEKRRLEI
jgi:hypothetical protein